MIRAIEIRQIAAQHGIKPEVIEKDYVLGWVIAALNQQEISSKWIFKGGTALKKCYFHEYRFSEDLDYSIVNAENLTEDVLLTIIESITNWIYSKSGIEFISKNQKIEIFENTHSRRVSQIRLYYKGPISPSSPQQAPRIKLDLTSGELLTAPPVISTIYHPYTDEALLTPQTLCYSFSEIFAEKLRALVERCRPRDIYDIIYCFEDRRTNLQEVATMFRQKCLAKNIKAPSSCTLEKQIAAAEPFWAEQLAHQIPDLRPFHEFANKAKEILDRILNA